MLAGGYVGRYKQNTAAVTYVTLKLPFLFYIRLSRQRYEENLTIKDLQ